MQNDILHSFTKFHKHLYVLEHMQTFVCAHAYIFFSTTDVTDFVNRLLKPPFLIFNSISEECREVERQSRENGKKEQAHLTDRPHSSLIGGERGRITLLH